MLENRTVLVTDGSRGIGVQIVLQVMETDQKLFGLYLACLEETGFMPQPEHLSATLQSHRGWCRKGVIRHFTHSSSTGASLGSFAAMAIFHGA